MKVFKIAAVFIMIAGILVLTYGSFSYTKKTHEASLGPPHLFYVNEKQIVYIPVWVGIGAMSAGGGLLMYPRKKNKKGTDSRVI